MVLLAVTIAVAAPPATGGIACDVVDAGGEAVDDVLITISSPVLVGGARQQIAHDGCAFAGLEAGSYELVAQRRGFAVARLTVDVAADEVAHARVTMSPGTDELPPAPRKTVDLRGDYPCMDRDSRCDIEPGVLRRIPSGLSYADVVKTTPLPAETPPDE